MLADPLVYDTWTDFKSHWQNDLGLDPHVSKRPQFLFRGQYDPEWTLRTGFDRAFSKLHKTRRQAVHTELINEYKKQLKRLTPDDAEQYELPDEEIVARGQHYTLPTRFLDWTESPYIAAFFAYQEVIQMRRGAKDSLPTQVAVWALNVLSPLWSANAGVDLIRVSARKNERLHKQMGWFTKLTSPHDTVEDFVRESTSLLSGSEETWALRKIKLPADAATEAIGDLHLMGIRNESLFGGEEAAARDAVARVTARLLGEGLL